MNLNPTLTPSTGQTVQVIGFGRRLVAYIIDGIILNVVGGCLGFVLGVAALPLTADSPEAGAGVNLLATLLGVAIGAVYFVALWATTGQTLGKMALGIKVIGADGSPVSWGKAILRYVGYIVSGLVLALGFIWVAFDARRQGWHDKIAGTYVVRKETQFSAAEGVTFVPSDAGSAVVWVVVAVLVLLVPLIAICVIAMLLLMGPVVGNVFSNIVVNLQTPSP
jgi:uncharacterized RDD family membrane protein YckC